MNEHEIERIARRLGARASEGLDVDALAHRVTARLRVARDREPAQRVSRWLAIAAGLAILVAGSLVTFRTGQPAMGDGGIATVVAPTLDDLSSTELGEVLDSLNWHAPVASYTMGIDDLDAGQLRSLLDLMEG